MMALNDNFKKIESFIIQIGKHIEKLEKYGYSDPFVTKKYKTEVGNFTKEAEEILKLLNNHEKTTEYRRKLTIEITKFRSKIEFFENYHK